MYNLCATKEGATPALLLPLDPPSALLDGVQNLVSALNAIDVDDMAKKDKTRGRAV